jgi:hypothetical protein
VFELGRTLPLDFSPANGRNPCSPLIDRLSREGLDLDESTVVDPEADRASNSTARRDLDVTVLDLGLNPSVRGAAQPPPGRASSQLTARPARIWQRVVYLDAEIAHSAFELRLPEKQLHCSQVARFLIYLCRLDSSHRMRAMGRAIKPSALTQEWTIRAYCRVERCGCVRTRWERGTGGSGFECRQATPGSRLGSAR